VAQRLAASKVWAIKFQENSDSISAQRLAASKVWAVNSVASAAERGAQRLAASKVWAAHRPSLVQELVVLNALRHLRFGQ